MAHFAELDENNVVLRVIVVDNKDTHDINGIESEEIGVAFCKKITGANTRWKQTSYNGNIRFRYAGIGYVYDETLDAFIYPQPYPSWILNTSTTEWEAPTPMPELTSEEREEGKYYSWNEDAQIWELKTFGSQI